MGKKTRYVYNKKSLRYEKVKRTPIQIISRLAVFCIILLLVSSGLTYLAFQYIPSPQSKALEREISQMEVKYYVLNEKLALISKVLNNVKDRDENVYKMLFGMAPLDNGLWEGGVGGHDVFANITDYSNSSDIIKVTKAKMKKLERQLVLQSKSIEEAEKLAEERVDKLASIPSIKPVKKSDLRTNIQLLSGFGMRMHPIHKVRKMHQGIDFTCPKGTQIYATGNGTVEMVKNSKIGYGKHVIINHGFGYETLYGHMSKIIVRKGQEVKKGELIGYVGDTGTSTADHLHYEVHVNGKAVNPINFVLDGLSPSEYSELVKQSEVVNQSFD